MRRVSVASDVDLLIDVPAGTGLIRVERIADAIAEVTPAGRRHHQRSGTPTHGPRPRRGSPAVNDDRRRLADILAAVADATLIGGNRSAVPR